MKHLKPWAGATLASLIALQEVADRGNGMAKPMQSNAVDLCALEGDVRRINPAGEDE